MAPLKRCVVEKRIRVARSLHSPSAVLPVTQHATKSNAAHRVETWNKNLKKELQNNSTVTPSTLILPGAGPVVWWWCVCVCVCVCGGGGGVRRMHHMRNDMHTRPHYVHDRTSFFRKFFLQNKCAVELWQVFLM